MKKILTASLVAIMAVTAANADIASTQYVNNKTGDLQFTGAKVVQSGSNLTAAVMALDGKLGTLAGNGDDSVESQIDSKINALDVDQVGGENLYIKTVKQADGEVVATTGSIDTEVTANSNNLVTSGAVSTAISAANTNITGLQTTVAEQGAAITNINTRVGDMNDAEKQGSLAYSIAANATNIATLNGDATTAGSVAKAVADAKSDLQTQIDNVVAGGLTEKSVEGTALKDGTVSETQLSTSVNASLDKADLALPKATYDAFLTTNTAAIETAKSEAIADAEAYADGLASNYATAAQGAKADLALPKATYDAFLTTNAAAIKAADDKGQQGITAAAAAQATADAAVAKTTIGAGADFSIPDDCKATNAVCSLVVRAGVAGWEKVVNE